MRAVEAVFVLAILLVGIVVTARLVRAAWHAARERLEEGAEWELDEVSDGTQVLVYADHPREERLLIGAVSFGAEDFDSRLYELRAQGREKVYALNQRERHGLLR
jgi:hypothetical protein